MQIVFAISPSGQESRILSESEVLAAHRKLNASTRSSDDNTDDRPNALADACRKLRLVLCDMEFPAEWRTQSLFALLRSTSDWLLLLLFLSVAVVLLLPTSAAAPSAPSAGHGAMSAAVTARSRTL